MSSIVLEAVQIAGLAAIAVGVGLVAGVGAALIAGGLAAVAYTAVGDL